MADHRHPLDRLREALAGRYRIVGELGRGGMGVVYLAYETALERPVALKLLPPDLANDPAQREWLLREARTAAAFTHPSIVPIHALEEAGDFLYFTMAYVEGETLTQRVENRGPLSVEEATWMLHDVARAVGYAHGKGVVHCDLKPDNIMLDAEHGRAVVMDFGAAFLRAKPDIVPAGTVVGTAPFMSPEQIHGQRGDARSDVYALGVTAYFAVTGRVPFDGPTTRDIFVQHVAAPVHLLRGGAALSREESRAAVRQRRRSRRRPGPLTRIPAAGPLSGVGRVRRAHAAPVRVEPRAHGVGRDRGVSRHHRHLGR
jgi:serine/threonine-protein kinase